jgi:hypothetical protein
MNCQWNADGKGPPVYVVGDSSAAQFAEAVTLGAEQQDNPVWIVTAPSCALVEGLRITSRGVSPYFRGPWTTLEFAHCEEYIAFTLEWLAHARPGIIIMASLDQYWWDSTLGLQTEQRQAVFEEPAKLRLLEELLSSTVHRLQASGHRIVLVQSTPTFRNPAPVWDPRECALGALREGACRRTLDVRHIVELQRPSRTVLQGVARATESTVLDLRDQFCDADTCKTHRADEWLFKDSTHLTVSASRSLAHLFKRAIGEAAPAAPR